MKENDSGEKQSVEILLIEDNPNDVELTLRALRRNNIANDVCVITDGEEALEFLFAEGRYADRDVREAPKLILLDLKLPKIDGLTILRKIKENEFLSLVPVVVLTSSEEDKDVINTYSVGVNSYIVKPIEFHKFIEVVSHVGLYWMIMNKSATTIPGAGETVAGS